MCKNKEHTHFQQCIRDTHFCQTNLRHPKRYALFEHDLLHNDWCSLYALLPARKSIQLCNFLYQIRTLEKLPVMHLFLSTLENCKLSYRVIQRLIQHCLLSKMAYLNVKHVITTRRYEFFIYRSTQNFIGNITLSSSEGYYICSFSKLRHKFVSWC